MENISAPSDAVLASNADILHLLAQLAAPRNRRSPKNRSDQQLAHNCISALLPAIAPSCSAISVPSTIPVSAVTANRSGAVGNTLHPISASQTQPVSRVKQRHFCRCGSCKWCVDNARWDRIFNEKFADPTYYGTLSVRHGSTLAGAR
jgi:hypothetical protein